MRKLMTELDDNVFINNWHCSVDEFCMNFHIYYIDSRCRRMTFDKESTEEEVRPHLLYLIDKDLKEGGWEKGSRLNQHQMLQQQEELYQDQMSEDKIKCHRSFNKLTTDERRSVAHSMGARPRDLDHEIGLKVWFQKTIMDTNNNRVHRKFLSIIDEFINHVYDPAEDTYYKQEWLYVDKEIK